MLATQAGTVVGGSTAADYGAVLRTGYFVWNRELDRMSKSRRLKLDVPLIWAKNIRPKSFCTPRAKKGRGVDFVRFEMESAAIVRSNAIVMQRTTNSSQPRRLIAARVSPAVLKKWGGFVTENHTIVLTAPDVRTLNLLCLLLNSAAVDRRYRLVSGTASVSVSLLRGLDLPCPEALAATVSKHGECELAVEQAYAQSAKQKSRLRA
jgi:adenine-specific DNA-methyltransferase